MVEQTLSHGLVASGLFAEVELGTTQDPDQLVIGLCRCTDGVLPWEAGMGVQSLWSRLAAHHQWEAHHVGATDSLMEFEGALTVDSSGHYLTVHLVAEPAVPAGLEQQRRSATAPSAALGS